MPPLKALLAFEAASRHGSFTQGAEELGVTPSAVSHQMQVLEDFLGVKLFQRRAGRALLTPAGRLYSRELAHAFGIIGNATSLVAPQSQHGHLVIASGPSFAAKWLQPRLPDFLGRHPGIKVRLSTFTDAEELHESGYDIAIAYAPTLAMRRDAEPLLVEKLRPLCSPLLARDLALRTPFDLTRATLIHSSNAVTWKDYFRKLGLGEVRPAGELWLDRSSMAIEAAAGGLGVILESEILAEKEFAEGKLVAPFDGAACTIEATTYYLVRSSRYRAGTPLVAFENWLRATLVGKR